MCQNLIEWELKQKQTLQTAKVTGVENFSSAEVMASDLRAGASLILAALKAKWRKYSKQNLSCGQRL